MKKAGIKVKSLFQNTSSVDKFLLCFLVLFMVQIGYGLFTDSMLSPQTGSIDAVVRTFASAVFGYFLSGHSASAGQSASIVRGFSLSATGGSSDAPKNISGFSDTVGATGGETTVLAPVSRNTADKPLRIYIVGGIGLVSLILMLLVRNIMPVTDTMIAPITQLRDMLSSSIGYLVGSRE